MQLSCELWLRGAMRFGPLPPRLRRSRSGTAGGWGGGCRRSRSPAARGHAGWQWLLVLVAAMLLDAQFAGFVHRIKHGATAPPAAAAVAPTAAAGSADGSAGLHGADRAADAHHCAAFDALALTAAPLSPGDATACVTPARIPISASRSSTLPTAPAAAFCARAPPRRYA